MAHCLGCSFYTVDKDGIGCKAGVANDYQSIDQGTPKLICIVCDCYFCLWCIKDFHKEIHSTPRIYHKECDGIINGFRMFAESSGKDHPLNFIGSCCYIKILRDIHRAEESNPCPPPQSQRRKRSMSDESPNKQMKYANGDNVIPDRTFDPQPESPLGGAFVIPGYNLIIPTDFLAMDVIALGRDEGVDGILHYVISEEQARFLSDSNIDPSTVRPNWFIFECKLKVRLPHQSSQNKRKKSSFQCRVFYIPKTTDVSEHVKGSNTIHQDDVPTNYLFDPTNNNTEALPDVSLLIGYNPKSLSRGSILLCRFHTERISIPRNPRLLLEKSIRKSRFGGLMLNSTPQQLKAQLESLLGNNGIERTRSGGSSGLMHDYDHILMSLMHSHNVTPRRSKGVIYLRHSNNLQLHVFYIGNSDSKPKQFRYTTPVKGGSFLMKPQLLQKHELLQNFIMTKPLSAMLVTALISRGHGNPALGKDFQINPIAVREELINAEQALIHIDNCEPMIACESRKLVYYQYYLSEFVNCTLVKHSVGRHIDQFKDNCASLENRVCFAFPGRFGDCGRGGAGLRNYTFAVLDWTRGNRARRLVMLHPRNQAFRPANFVNRVTRPIWTYFVANADGNLYVPDEVANVQLNY